jgi:glutamate 5-kinase
MKKIYVIKIGGSVLLTKDRAFDVNALSHIVEQVVALHKKEIGVVLVVSGAVAYGSNFIDLSERLGYKRQAAAGIGQVHLMTKLEKLFHQHKLLLAQVLITKHDYLYTQHDIKRLLEYYINQNVVPVINENDPMELNSFGGNDLLAGEIAKLVRAEKLIMMSTMERSAHATGGGATKHQAIAYLRDNSIAAHIVNGREKNVLLTFFSQEEHE